MYYFMNKLIFYGMSVWQCHDLWWHLTSGWVLMSLHLTGPVLLSWIWRSIKSHKSQIFCQSIVPLDLFAIWQVLLQWCLSNCKEIYIFPVIFSFSKSNSIVLQMFPLLKHVQVLAMASVQFIGIDRPNSESTLIKITWPEMIMWSQWWQSTWSSC